MARSDTASASRSASASGSSARSRRHSSTTCSPTASFGEGLDLEAALRRPHWQLDNLIGIVDVNNQQADGPSSEVTGLEPLAAKWEAFGWHTQRVDGNDIDALVAAFDQRALGEPRPRMIICDTKMAKGVPFLEEREMTHFLRVDEGEWDQALLCSTPAGRRLSTQGGPHDLQNARTLPEQGEGGMQQPKKRLTTSAMIASLAAPGQRTRSAPFGHAVVAAAKAGPRSSA